MGRGMTNASITFSAWSAMSLVGGTALDWEKGYGNESNLDLSSFDSVSGAGFDTHPVAAGIQPSPGG